jgi:flagellar biosynthesis/type III secretory pathway protein FliH
MPPQPPDSLPGSNPEREESTVSRSLPFPSPEVIREFADRGAQWLFEDPRNVRDLLHMSDPDLARSLDFERAERINRTFIPADLQKLENDLLFRVPVVGDAEPIWVYVLLEHQSTVDPLMALRLYLYIGEVWKAQRQARESKTPPAGERRISPVVPLVFYTGDESWPQPISLMRTMDVPAGFDRFVPQWETLFLSLHGLDEHALSQGATAVGQALRVWQAERLPLDELERVLVDALRNLEGLSEAQSDQWARVVWFFVVLAYHRRKRSEFGPLFAALRERVDASHFQEKPDMVVVEQSMAQYVAERAKDEGRQEGLQEGRQEGLQEGRQEGLEEGRQEGLQEGRQEGLEEGRQEGLEEGRQEGLEEGRQEGLQEGRQEGLQEGWHQGERGALTIVLKARFGEIPPDVEVKVNAANAETLDRWLAMAVTARTIEEALA